MASKAFACLALVLSLYVSGALGGITCERLDRSACAYAVSATGMRCVLEKRAGAGADGEEFTCRSSGIEAEGIHDYVESDECVEACGLDRNSLGISSDSLLDSCFTHKLCSSQCYQACPNVIDLYFNLAAGEGVFLPRLCEVSNARRAMAEIRSSGVVLAEAPASSEKFLASAPTEASEPFGFGPALPPM